MNFQDLHESLRLELARRIETGALTGTRLAQQAGFQQAHISNFLNRKRALSLEGLDRVLAAQGLTIDQILPLQVAAAADVAQPQDTLQEEIAMVPIVSPSAAMEEGQIKAANVIEILPLAAAQLADNRKRTSPRTANWQRFVAVRVDPLQAAAMGPVLTPGTIAVIDRHYNSLAPYRSHEPSLFAMRHTSGLLLRYVEFDGRHLVLRPLATDCAVQLISIAPGETPSDFIVGRVCLLVHEL